MSVVLNKSALKAVNRIGDIICPKNKDFPSYTELGCVEHVNSMIKYAPHSDIKDLNLLLSILSIMPKFVLTFMVKAITKSHSKNGVFSGLFRQLDFGLKGIILGTYYSGNVGSNYKGKTPLEIIEFSTIRMEIN